MGLYEFACSVPKHWSNRQAQNTNLRFSNLRNDKGLVRWEKMQVDGGDGADYSLFFGNDGVANFLDDTMEDIGADGLSYEVQDVNKVKKRRQGPFEKLGLSDFVTRAVARIGYNLPTPIQRKAIPAILSGCDVVAMARTGSGKTAAFLLPMIERLAAHKTVVGVRSVILEPTREMAFQIEKVTRQLCRFTDLRLCTIVGGCGMERQFEGLARNPDCVIACPGRFLHHVIEADLALSAVEYLVIDEADQMFELGLGEQVEQLLQRTSPHRQCVLLSATLPSQLVEFSSVGLRSPELIRLDVDANLPPTLDMWFLYTRTEEKLAALLYLLREIFLQPYFPAQYSTDVMTSRPMQLPQGVLLFVASRHHAEFVGLLLERAEVAVTVAYGSMDLQARKESVARFSKGLAKVLVATDVAARGLDIPEVGVVINFDFPISPKHFVHRVGRTARANRAGLAVSLITRDELAYAIEVLLFAGVSPFQSAKDASTKANNLTSHTANEVEVAGTGPSASSHEKSVIGGMPNLAADMEFVREQLALNVDLQGLHKTAQNAEIQYRKTRRPASRQSIKQAKRILDGDASKLLSALHPALAQRLPCSKQQQSAPQSDYASFLSNLHSVKPKTTSQCKKGGRQGGVLPSSIVTRMETMSFVRQLSNFSVQPSSEKSTTEQEANNLQSDVTPEPSTATEHSVVVERRPRLSAAARRLLRKTKDSLPTAFGASAVRTSESFLPERKDNHSSKMNFDKIFDWQSNALQSHKSQFFLSAEKSEAETQQSFRDSQLSLRSSKSSSDGLRAIAAAQLDLIPEDARQQCHRVQVVRKWNALRKRYVMTPVDAVSGKGLRTKEVKQRNEAGVICRGEMQKTGVYKKWVRTAGCSIPRVGDIEHPINQTQTPRTKKRSSLHEMEPNEEAPPLSALTKDKGLLEAIATGAKLTRKEERKVKRLRAAQLGTVHHASTSKRVTSELKNAQQLAKVKKDALKTKAKQDKRTRMALRKTSKEKHMEKRKSQNETRAAPRRSFVLFRQSSKKRRG